MISINSISSLNTGRVISAEDAPTHSASTKVKVETRFLEKNDTPSASGTPGENKETKIDMIKELRKQIEEAQKRLQQQLKILQDAKAGHQSDEFKMAAVAAAQAQVTETTTLIQALTSSLLIALVKKGSSSSGAILNTKA